MWETAVPIKGPVPKEWTQRPEFQAALGRANATGEAQHLFLIVPESIILIEAKLLIKPDGSVWVRE